MSSATTDQFMTKLAEDTAIETCLKDTAEHRKVVAHFLTKLTSMILIRGSEHDLSKDKSPELEVFAEYGPKLKTSTYGSDEYHSHLRKMNVALD